MRTEPEHADPTFSDAHAKAGATRVNTTNDPALPRVETQLVTPTPPEPPDPVEPRPREDLAEREEGRNALGKVVVIAAVVSLLGGGLGAWIYEGVFRPSSPEPPKAEVPSGPSPAESIKPQGSLAANREAKKLDQEIENVSSRVDKLQERFAALPKPEAAPDLSSIRDQLQSVLKDDETVSSLPGRLAALADRVAALERSVGTLQGQADSNSESSKKTRPASTTSPSPDRSAPASPAPRDTLDQPKRTDPGASTASPPPPIAAAFAHGAELFHQGRYREAREVFTRLEELYPSDARVWYYAALTNGLVTRRWDGDTQFLVQRGLERERLGSPAPSQIDSTFAGLTMATGRDWLAGYRKSLTK